MDFQNRQYDPQIGRFLSVDPLADDGQEEWSPYAAMGNNPAMMVDPLGLKFDMQAVDNSSKATPIYGGWGKREYNPGAAIDAFTAINAAMAEGAHDLQIRGVYWEAMGMFKGVGTGLSAGNDLTSISSGYSISELNEMGAVKDAGGNYYHWVQDNSADLNSLRKEYYFVDRQEQKQSDKGGSVGQPGVLESAIPVWGSGRAAVDDFQNGRWGWGIFNTAMAISDIFLIKSIVTGVGKIAVKGGGVFYRAMSNAEYAALKSNGGLTYMAGKELFVSSSASYSREFLQKSTYDVLVEFKMRSGAMSYFNEVGVMHRTAAGSSGWASRGNLLWKSEQGVMNLGIQSNTHMFNPWIKSFKTIK